MMSLLNDCDDPELNDELDTELDDVDESVLDDIHTPAPKSKILWAGPWLDGKCIIAVDSKFDPAKEWNNMYFTLNSYNYEFEGILEVRMQNINWLEMLVERIGYLYAEDITRTRKDNHDTLH